MGLCSGENMPAWRRLMNEKPEENNALDLSALDFGPSWARDKSENPRKKFADKRGPKAPQSRGERGERGQRRPQKGGPRHGGENRRDERRAPRPKVIPAPEGVVAEVMPIEEGVDNLAKEIVASGRTHSVFELSRMILSSRERYKIVFRKEDGSNAFYQCKFDGAVFLTKDECVSHFAQSDLKSEIYDVQEVEVDAPAGDYSSVSKCGISGHVFGPSNYHEFSQLVASHHRTHFSRMDLGKYKSMISADSSEEAVQAWKDSMSKVKRYTSKQDATQTFDGELTVLEHFSDVAFDEVYRETHRADVDSQIPGKQLSPGLLTLLKETIADQRRYPSKLAPFLCRQLSGRNLAVFKWQGKLHCGPSRPHTVAEDVNLSDRLTSIREYVESNSGLGVDKLWVALLPADISDEDKKQWYHDLHWMLNQGYVLLMHDGLLFPSSASKKKVVEKKSSKGSESAEGEK